MWKVTSGASVTVMPLSLFEVKVTQTADWQSCH